MKGLTHFISGVAFGTFFPGAVAAAAQSSSMILVLGGVGGILPDTFDFKFARYLETFDVEVDPDHDRPDPKAIAEAVAAAVDRAASEGRTIKLVLHTIRLGADAWRKYSVDFNQEKGRIEVTIGPVVSTSQVPYLPSLPPADERFAFAEVRTPFVHTYDRANDVTIFSGPDFDLKPRDGFVEIEFLSWHRRWSHSFTVAVLGGLAACFTAWAVNALGWMEPALPAWMYGVVTAGGGCMHIIEDQTGFMGSNLFYPFTKERMPGARWFHSNHALSNFTTFYLMICLIVFNLDRLNPTGPVLGLSWWKYWLYAFVIPMSAVHLLAALWSEDGDARRSGCGCSPGAADDAKEDGGGI